jgi:hypothetical protein
LSAVSAKDDLAWLSEWLAARCDADWNAGPETFKLVVVDNPGWWLWVRLAREPAAKQVDRTIISEGEASDAQHAGTPTWIKCRVKDGIFHGAGDPSQLQRIVACFRHLIES